MRSIIFILGIACLPLGILAQQSWSITGNSGTKATTNFIGTKDAEDFVFKTNSIEAGRILNNAAWRFGSSTNFARFDPNGELSFGGTGVYKVGGNKYVFQSAGNIKYGLFFNSTTPQYEFRNSNAVSVFSINANNGNSHFAGKVGIGNATPSFNLDVTGNANFTDGLQTGNIRTGIVGPDYSTIDNNGNLRFFGSAGHLVKHDQFALLCDGEPNEGLYMNGNPNQWEFRDEAGSSFFTLNVQSHLLTSRGGLQVGIVGPDYSTIDKNGNLSFSGNAAYNVADNKYVFRYSGNPNYGLVFNSDSKQYEFRSGNAAPTFFVNADNGNATFNGTLKIGAYTLPASDGISGQVLKTNGTGMVSWSDNGGGVTYTAGNGIIVGPDHTITNTAPDQTVAITAGTGISVTGSYPNFTISSGTGSGNGADVFLSNLSSTSINQSLVPKYDNLDLGISSVPWKNAFITAVISRTVDAIQVTGYSPDGTAVRGTSPNNPAVYGQSTSNIGVLGTGMIGISGEGLGYGVKGVSSNLHSAGVYGQSYETGILGEGVLAGVTGTSTVNWGVKGIGGSVGIHGYSAEGIAIYGQTESGPYAGFFAGNVYSTASYMGSDKKLKQHIQSFSNAMDILNKLQPKQYEFRQDGNYKLMNMPNGNHYGLIAQEVEEVLPGLIKETKFDPNIAKQVKPGDDQNTKKEEEIRFKAMNYTELIPIMIKGMQELSKTNDEKDAAIKDLQKQIDELKQLLKGNSTATNGKIQNSQDVVELKSTSVLEQNTPNPFTNNTSIHYSLPANNGNAFINFYSSAGVVLKSVKLHAAGKGVVDVKASELASGIYQYSLIIDGKVIETKQMIRLK
jgi:hypothetical protein